MKLVKNNRDEKIKNVEDILTSYDIDINHHKGQNELIEKLTYKILLDKVSKKNSRFVYKESNKVYKLLIDCYERALASVSLFFFKNNISSSIGYVYLISNPAFPNYIKIGYSQDAQSRLSMYQVSTPFKDFKLEKYIIVRNAYCLEQNILQKYKTSLANGEWVYCDNINILFEDIAKISSNLKMYNRFDTSSSGAFFNDISNSEANPLNNKRIEQELDNYYKNINFYEDCPHIRDKTGKILIRYNRISKLQPKRLFDG